MSEATTTALAVTPQTALTKKELSDSKFFPSINTPAKSAVVSDMARAMNFSVSFVAANVTFVNGKPATGAILLAAAIKRSEKYDFRVKMKTDKECRIEFFERVGGKLESLFVESFTMVMASRAGLAKGPTWLKYPEAMLYNRCLSAGAKAHCPDALAGYPIYLAEELLPSSAECNEDGMPLKAPVEDAVIIPSVGEIEALIKETGTFPGDILDLYFAEDVSDLNDVQRVDIVQKLKLKKEVQ